MSHLWDGVALRNYYAEKLGSSTTAFRAHVLRWMNQIQDNIAASHEWPFLRTKIKLQVASGTHEVDISPQVPSAPTIAASTGGTLTADSACLVKTTFVIFDESGKEVRSIESEPSEASASATPSGTDLTLTVTAIDTYDGSTSVKPTTIWRRLYLKQGSGDYVLAKTIEDNTTTSTTIAADPTSVINPPEISMVISLANDDPCIEGSNVTLTQVTIDDIRGYDPSNSSGIPTYYARVDKTKILLYPAPSSTITLSYYVFKRPCRIFADHDRPIQIPQELRQVLEQGVQWLGFDFKNKSGKMAELEAYNTLLRQAKGDFGGVRGKSRKVRSVETDWRGWRT